MTLLFIDGADHTSSAIQKWTFDSANVCTQVAGRFGNGWLAVSGQNRRNRIAVTAGDVFFVGFALKTEASITANRQVCFFAEGATVHCDLRIEATSNKLFVTRNGTQIGATGTLALAPNTWYYVEMQLTVHDSTGSIEVRVNGTAVIGPTGSLDTRNAGTGVVDNIGIGALSVNGSQDLTFDDIYICDDATVDADMPNNTFRGDLRVDTLFPTGAGTTTQMTPSAGSNWQNVDETTPNDDTDYNSETTVGDLDLYAMESLPTTPATIYGIQELTRWRKDDAGALTGRQVIRTGSTNYEGANQTMLDTYAYSREIREVSPNTGVAWTNSDIDALEAGQKLQA